MTSGVCIHGYLRRQCEACDLADQLEQMTEDRDRLRAECAKALVEMDDDGDWGRASRTIRAALAHPAQEGDGEHREDWLRRAERAGDR